MILEQVTQLASQAAQVLITPPAEKVLLRQIMQEVPSKLAPGTQERQLPFVGSQVAQDSEQGRQEVTFPPPEKKFAP